MATYPTLIAEVAFGAAPGTEYLLLNDTLRGKLDTAQLAPDDWYADVSGDLMKVVIDRGRQRRLEQYRASRATIDLRDANADYDPNNLAGQYVSAGITQVEAMRRARLRATYGAITYPLFGGYTDDWVPDRSNELSRVMVLSASGGMKVLANFDPDASAPTGTGEDSGARITRVLNNAGYPTNDRVIDVGNSTLQATTLAQNALTECYLTADSEGGAFYELADGRLNFDRRRAIYEDTRMRDSQATFDNVSGLPFTGLTPRNDAELVKNDIRLARTGGTTQTAFDAASQAKYLKRSLRRTDLLLETDTEVDLLTDWHLYNAKDREVRFDEIVLDPVMNDALWPVVLGLELRSRVTVVDRPRGMSAVTKDCFVEGIKHMIVPPLVWKTTLRLSSATPFTGMFILDHATLGKLDTGILATF